MESVIQSFGIVLLVKQLRGPGAQTIFQLQVELKLDLLSVCTSIDFLLSIYLLSMLPSRGFSTWRAIFSNIMLFVLCWCYFVLCRF